MSLLTLPVKKMRINMLRFPNYLTKSSKTIQSLRNYCDTECLTKPNLPNFIPTKVKSMKSGLKVATEEWCSPMATVGMWIASGSRYENEHSSGATHFMEHMIFKGTGNRSCSELQMEIENLGAQLYAHTDREYTAIYANCFSNDVPQILEILADCIVNPVINDSEINREKAVILRELQEVENDHRSVVFDYLHAIAYQGTPMANTIIGNVDDVQNMNCTILNNYTHTYYKPDRIVVAGAGGVNHDEFAKLAKWHMQCLDKSTCGPPSDACIFPCRYTGSEVRVRDDSMPEAHVAIAVEGAGITQHDALVLSVAAELLGSYSHTDAIAKDSSNNLTRACAEDHSCRFYESFNLCYTDTALWGVYFVCDPLSIDLMMFCVQDEFLRLATSATEGEVQRAKSQFIIKSMKQLGTQNKVCDDMGRQILLSGKRMPVYDMIHKVEQINATTFRNVVYKYVYDRCPVVVGVGPVEQLPNYNRVRSSMYWIRF